jgi:hypothetical protein
MAFKIANSLIPTLFAQKELPLAKSRLAAIFGRFAHHNFVDFMPPPAAIPPFSRSYWRRETAI